MNVIRSLSKTLLLNAVLLLLVSTVSWAQTKKVLAAIAIKNSLNISRKDVLAEVPYANITEKLKGNTTFKVLDAITRKELPYQLECRGGAYPVNLLIQVSLKPMQELKLQIIEGKSQTVAPKTFARYVPERKDDFAWENDKLAFRMYGKALESTNENAFGMDVWTKRTSNLIIDKWYKLNDYHVDHGEGLDHYSVGASLGAGDIAPYFQDSIYFPKNYRKYEVLDNGPLRSTFRLTYDTWKMTDKTLSVTKTISLDAGSQFNKIEINFSIDKGDSIAAVVGIVKRKESGTMFLSETKRIMAYWEPAQPGNGTTGIGTILPGPVKSMKVTNQQLLTVTTVKNNQPFIYFNGAVWNKIGVIKTDKEWFDYLSTSKTVLENPLKVRVN